MGEVTGRIRKSGVKMLLGDDDWVVRRENGVDYGYHVTKCMFSAGNVNERRRMGEIVKRRSDSRFIRWDRILLPPNSSPLGGGTCPLL